MLGGKLSVNTGSKIAIQFDSKILTSLEAIMSRTVILIFTMLFCTVQRADGASFIGYASGIHDGLELSVGFTKHISGFTFSANPLAGVIYSGESNPRYRKETFSNGQTVCRDLTNGQFSKKENCTPGIRAEYTPSVEATYDLTSPITIGVGYRGGDSPGPYGALMYRRANQMYFGLRAGPGYQGISLGVLY